MTTPTRKFIIKIKNLHIFNFLICLVSWYLSMIEIRLIDWKFIINKYDPEHIIVQNAYLIFGKKGISLAPSQAKNTFKA